MNHLNIAIYCQQGEQRIALHVHNSSAGIVALCGPSGVGKTTVLNMIAGLVRPHGGYIALHGRCLFHAVKGICLPPEQRGIGYIFQEARLFPHYSVEGNLRYGMPDKNKGLSAPEYKAIVAMLGIEHLLARRPASLSGGEKQRVAFARAVLARPRLLLMDEPLASLDMQRKAEILPYIKRLNAELGIPILYVSHAPDEIAQLAAQVVVLPQQEVE